ncbi:amino acid permease [Philodulcilactobacillus myokoensis]|uniref:Amino acid permease n=1 Tax=Philodulcilactobacillus myokoensis TaxID=2929573 RepID=A0A9W6B098_9LACO|nr:APC family permease [Philodulcilactobacillus myokoensis]GLB46406.1 amino acid permease [Philodulcilactobacillus myokoensis]
MKKAKANQLNFLSIVMLGINAIIGSGIFLLPTTGMKLFGPASILILIFDAILAFTIGMCFAECSGLFDETGGSYIYADAAFGHFIGYEVGIAAWVIRIIAEASMYVALATAIGGFFPSLNTPVAKNVIVSIIAILLMALNISGIRMTAILNNVVTAGKLIPIILVIVLGLFFIHPANFHPFFVPKLTTSGNFSNAALTLFYIFTGFEGLVVTAGDMKNVKKNLPRAVMLVLSIVAAIYILVMVACIGVLGKGLANTTVPLQATLTRIMGPFGGILILIGSVLSIGGICIAQSFITPRSVVALSKHGITPKFFEKTNKRDAPYVAIIFSTILVLLLAYTGTFTKLAQISAVSRFAQFIPTCIAVIVFRHKMKNAKRSFKLPFGPVIPIIAVLVSLWLLINTDPSKLIWGFGSLIIAIPFYFVTRAYRKRKLNH